MDETARESLNLGKIPKNRLLLAAELGRRARGSPESASRERGRGPEARGRRPERRAKRRRPEGPTERARCEGRRSRARETRASER